MKLALRGSELFVKLEGETVSKEPIEIGGMLLAPGMLFSRLGEKERTSISMKDGYYLEYVGYIVEQECLLFREYLQDWQGWMNPLWYVDKNTLLQQTSANGFRDIRIKHLEPVKNPKPKTKFMQVKMFEE